MSHFNFNAVPPSPGGTQAASTNPNFGTQFSSSQLPPRPSPAQAHQSFSAQAHHHQQPPPPPQPTGFQYDPPSPSQAGYQQHQAGSSWASCQSTPVQATLRPPAQSPAQVHQGQNDHEMMCLMERTLQNPTEVSLIILNKHHGDASSQQVLSNLGFCDHAARRKETTLSDEIAEHKTQGRIKEKQLVSLRKSITKHDSLVKALRDLDDPHGPFPLFFAKDKEVIQTWLIKRLGHVVIAAAKPEEIQNALQLMTYELLNLIPQDFFVFLLNTLQIKGYHKSPEFQNYVQEMKRTGIVCIDFKIDGIYHAGKNNYSRNYHRALVAFYLGLQADDMRGLKRPIRKADQQACPWGEGGYSYMPDDAIFRQQAGDDVDMDLDTPERNTKRPRNE